MSMKMRNLLCTTALLLGMMSTAVAQDQPLGKRIQVQVGSAIPVGRFDKTHFEDEYPPFARTGILLTASYARDLKPGIAVGGTAGWRRHQFNLDEFVGADDELVEAKEAGAWQTGFALADVYLQSRGRHFFGYLKGSLGGAYSQSPAVRVDTRYGAIVRSSGKAASLAYGLAAGVGVEADRIGLSLEVGSLGTSPTFKVTDARNQSTSYRQPMRSVHMAFGVYYSL